MLTKNLLLYKTRNDKVYPTYINPNDEGLLQLATQLCSVFQNAAGLTLNEIDAAIEDAAIEQQRLRPAFYKLLVDRCEFAEGDDDAVAAKRRELILAAQFLRTELKGRPLPVLQDELKSRLNYNAAEPNSDLYGDLPEFKKVLRFKPITPPALLHRYNCAQIQGLLLQARTVSIKITGASVLDKRNLFRALKFSRLLAEFKEGKKDTLEIELTGPLQIFQNVQTYGMRLANFFPYVLLLPEWELRAEVKAKNKQVTLVVDEECGIESHYKNFKGYVPEEYEAFIEYFKTNAQDWTVDAGTQAINLGGQAYCFPDFVFEHTSGEVRHLEIFHKWHEGAFANRLKALEARPIKNLILGAHKSFQQTIAGMSVISFSNFPNPDKVLRILQEI